jgi:hypothetical protein
MCALKSRAMSAVCTWGLRGIFFLTLVLFVLISHGAVRCFVAGLFPREGRKPGVFMNPRVIPTGIAFWPGEKELNQHIKHTTLEPNYNQLFLNLGRVSHECQ